MERLVGTVSRGVRAPIIREGDNLVQIVVDSVLAAGQSEGFSFHDRDVVAVTEAVVARAQGNYAHINDIAADVKAKLGGETIGVIFPILSRNRFSVCLKGIARGAKKVVLMLSFPADEVGNHLIDEDLLDEKGVNPWSDVLTEEKYRELSAAFCTHSPVWTTSSSIPNSSARAALRLRLSSPTIQRPSLTTPIRFSAVTFTPEIAPNAS